MYKEFEKGKKVEKQFIDEFLNAIPSTTDQDIYDGYDLTIGDIKIDVKSMKKLFRSDLEPDENIHWVELVNVNGNKGWVYKKAHYFVFETEGYWIFVKRKDLVSYIEEIVKGKEIQFEKIIHEIYQRKGRKDQIVLVKTLDLVYISSKIIKK